MPNVKFIRADLAAQLSSYVLIADCVEGEQRIKAKAKTYLPAPNAADVSPENKQRYKDYLTRSVFYNVTRRTMFGLLGQVFERSPVIEVPELLRSVVEDATGLGISLEQSSKEATRNNICYGRLGLFVDYPQTEEPASRADIEAGNIRPTIQVIEAIRIINWRTALVGAKERLTLVVFTEKFVEKDDGFEMKEGIRYRVLRLRGDVYVSEIWYNTTGPKQTFIPVDSQGKTFADIPFMFVGSADNDPSIDPAPLYDMASINVGHYRNSADYEETVFIVGQPTPYVTGLTEEWVHEVFNDGPIQLGSRAAIPLPAGATVGLLQAQANTLAKEAMDHKERQMVALGAKLVEQRNVQRTAREAEMENANERSSLGTIADNVSAAYTWALNWCALFVGADALDIKFELNTEFDLIKLTPEERQSLVLEWQQGAITFEEMRASFRRGGIATVDDKSAKTQTQAEMKERAALLPKPVVQPPKEDVTNGS